MANGEAALEVVGLTRSFGTKQVLQGLDVRLLAGARLGLAGANGSGKTTFLRCVAGSLTPTDGSVTVHGRPAGSLESRTITGVAVAPEKAFYLRLSGRENLRFYAALRTSQSTARRQVESIIEELELGFVSERVDRCSSGMLQQLAFARSLLGDPSLLLLDEPTRSLDDAAVERLWGALTRRPKTTVVLASHSHEDLERCDERMRLS